ncbi:hypothetical protein F53441_11240 [Fusarium austroafricanum]|uniref:LysM domain-containing protein n=1 Tax=Fusarium austroafricanum TaxID=2364996 RepID=A0A8H4NTW1_9HYPO|nr:hypothetical protein F53441_11240 [Fusarium austroafricanum]
MKFSTITAILFSQAGLSLAAPPTLTRRAPATAIESIKGDNGIETPLPIQPGMVDNCDKFFFVPENIGCLHVAQYFGITVKQFVEWNPTVGGEECRYLWANANVCVRTIGYEYPRTTACYGSNNILPWGKNKNPARTAISDWCAKDNHTYKKDEKRKGCVNAPDGSGKFTWTIENHHMRDTELTVGECRSNLVQGPNQCAEGGAQIRTKSWVIHTEYNTGKC